MKHPERFAYIQTICVQGGNLQIKLKQLTNFLFPKYFDNIPAAQNRRSLFVILRQDYQSNKDTTGVNSKVFSPLYNAHTQVKFVFKGMG